MSPSRKKGRKVDPQLAQGSNPRPFVKEKPAWTFELIYRISEDQEISKCWGIKKMIEDFEEHILPKLVSYESMTWQKIIDASGGRTVGTNSHFVEDSDIDKRSW